MEINCKKPQLGPTKLFRVIDIPQNDYSIPTNESSNRYVPYGKYKGKTYIYVEGEETDDYVRDISSSDITSSSESEYEEMDINDIYGYKSPKYKTLIEVVLKPSSKTTYDDTSMYQNDNNNKLTDEEWNQLKQDFIINMLQSDNMDISLENLNGNTTNTQPNIVDSSMEEKPFITSIQDRKLYSNSDITYNIDWNIPENIRTNNVDSPKYVSPNLYSGIDLINDSLNNDKHIDIYDELLKRKENELYGTNYPKNTTTTNRVAKPISGDPILNQLDLYDKWLERNKDMYNQWNNSDTLNQWNIQRDNDNTTDHTHNLLNTNLSIEISSDMTHDTSNMDMSDTNTYTYLDDMDSFENSSDENLL
ncbi:erythrocyte membrane protein 1, PfEMP1, putative [Plasmodium sp. gorilla clade G2]|uniref:erythrocyte membrane protein 1, PfEMP1, putative n=1 Tax=Plasmodium sp. gorilla clade G2 TaxID=880535 RepID=UPI000D2B6954|nr:erythrocyte membrane protein 1, PfEMP1, putative [Plasmodium sp. gorilla clade G2]SOV20453.1 erythrocyte membrane protein 1, PfEMP1, putative [Plasmodium sp. gorilla clade G2]